LSGAKPVIQPDGAANKNRFRFVLANQAYSSYHPPTPFAIQASSKLQGFLTAPKASTAVGGRFMESLLPIISCSQAASDVSRAARSLLRQSARTVEGITAAAGARDA
jgi:hypothetical protein